MNTIQILKSLALDCCAAVLGVSIIGVPMMFVSAFIV
ncbi:hypothetical protein MTBUT4_80053 [Magnetospirillum sp. UT-4]|nr:hypothetical protein MTBUT4_80053 [Magnetospirillum sp. UT-4]